MGATPIEWTDHSINPIRARMKGRIGHHCVKISPGCKHCYSSRRQPRFGLPVFQEQAGSDVETFLDTHKLEEVLRRKKPTKYFWCDMTDMFGEWVPLETIALCFATMAASPWHTHQVLTKRAAGMRQLVTELYANDGALLVGAAEELAAMMSWCHAGENDWKFPLANVWLGVSCEDQERADERIPDLLATAAAVRFVSAEPLLGPIDLTSVAGKSALAYQMFGVEPRRLNWVIVGGESGHGARECHLGWVEDIVKQCKTASVPVFVKQLGAVIRVPNDDKDEWPTFTRVCSSDDFLLKLPHAKGGNMEEWPERLRVRQFPEAPLDTGQPGRVRPWRASSEMKANGQPLAVPVAVAITASPATNRKRGKKKHVPIAAAGLVPSGEVEWACKYKHASATKSFRKLRAQTWFEARAQAMTLWCCGPHDLDVKRAGT